MQFTQEKYDEIYKIIKQHYLEYFKHYVPTLIFIINDKTIAEISDKQINLNMSKARGVRSASIPSSTICSTAPRHTWWTRCRGSMSSGNRRCERTRSTTWWIRGFGPLSVSTIVRTSNWRWKTSCTRNSAHEAARFMWDGVAPGRSISSPSVARRHATSRSATFSPTRRR